MKPDDYSNISYLLGGLYLLMNFSPVPGIAMILLAIGSFLGHVHGGKWWAADWVGMYLVFGALITHNLELSWLWLIPVALAGYRWGVPNYYLIGAFWVAATASALLVGLNIMLPTALFAVALIIRQIGEIKHYQLLHSLWHVVTMPAIVLLCS